MRTYYDVLGIDRNARSIDIEYSYRYGVNEQIDDPSSPVSQKKKRVRLQQLREAYLVLASPSRRLAYDRRLHQLELARARRRQRLRTTASMLLLVIGLALVISGVFYRMERSEQDGASMTLLARGGRWLLDVQHAEATQQGGRDQANIGSRTTAD
ncbi:DnaJ domain-containing protein [Noviherbaspirillum sp.]|uniref:DnaJ domain-containing protein n=1 Tax=Noviherbaspirillum sp. TaxID=1926288 RepID=UPI002B48F5D0|nr:DnaJ domain-containing protein [Noviherbaspirillum sp.]HJV81918.1 DnaJ domain-containing protein [Noviherbaspirillum sp.]